MSRSGNLHDNQQPYNIPAVKFKTINADYGLTCEDWPGSRKTVQDVGQLVIRGISLSVFRMQ